MPLYLVRWPTLQVSLVRARNEEALLDLLDEASDPGGCTYKVYKGPVWVDFALPFKIRDVTPDKKVPTEPSDFTIDPCPEFDGELYPSFLEPGLPGTDAVDDMCRRILRFAFPSLLKYMEMRDDAVFNGDEDSDEGEQFPEGLRAALVADLMPLVRAYQARAALQERQDLEAQMMKQAGVTVMLPVMRRALEHALKTAPSRKAD